MEKFTLHHTALYAKGWYKRENKQTIWEDLKVILSLDDYSGEYMTKSDVVRVVLNQCQRLDLRAFKDLLAFADGISANGCWRHGYYTKDCNWGFKTKDEELPEYDYYEAIIRYCISNLACASIKELGLVKLPMPDYIKGLPRKNGVSNKRLIEMFG